MAGTLPANRDFSPISVQGPPYIIPPCPQGTHPGGRKGPERSPSSPQPAETPSRRRKTRPSGRENPGGRENPRVRKNPAGSSPRATLPEQFLQFGGVVAGEDDVMVSDGVGKEVAGGLGGEPQDGLGAAEIGLGFAP